MSDRAFSGLVDKLTSGSLTAEDFINAVDVQLLSRMPASEGAKVRRLHAVGEQSRP